MIEQNIVLPQVSIADASGRICLRLPSADLIARLAAWRYVLYIGMQEQTPWVDVAYRQDFAIIGISHCIFVDTWLHEVRTVAFPSLERQQQRKSSVKSVNCCDSLLQYSVAMHPV